MQDWSLGDIYVVVKSCTVLVQTCLTSHSQWGTTFATTATAKEPGQLKKTK